MRVIPEFTHTDDVTVWGAGNTISVIMNYRSTFKFMCVDLSEMIPSLRTYIVRVQVWNYRDEAGYDLDILENNMFIDTVMFLPVEDSLPSNYINVFNTYTSAGEIFTIIYT